MDFRLFEFIKGMVSEQKIQVMLVTAEKAREIGDQLGVDWNKVDQEEFRMGIEIEFEHRDLNGLDYTKSAQIALAHLRELPDYYTRLKKMEVEGDAAMAAKDAAAGKTEPKPTEPPKEEKPAEEPKEEPAEEEEKKVKESIDLTTEEIKKQLTAYYEQIADFDYEDQNHYIRQQIEQKINALVEELERRGEVYEKRRGTRDDGEEYPFDELSKAAQEEFIQSVQEDENYLSYEWWDDIYRMAKEDLEKAGYSDPDIHFSGFWSQGDGASFESKNVDLRKLAVANKEIGKELKILLRPQARKDVDTGDKTFKPMSNKEIARIAKRDVSLDDFLDNIGIKITKNGHYEHEMEMDIDYEYYGEEDLPNLDEFMQMVLEDARDRARDIYKKLAEEYDYLSSDEAVKETIIANEWTYAGELAVESDDLSDEDVINKIIEKRPSMDRSELEGKTREELVDIYKGLLAPESPKQMKMKFESNVIASSLSSKEIAEGIAKENRIGHVVADPEDPTKFAVVIKEGYVREWGPNNSQVAQMFKEGYTKGGQSAMRIEGDVLYSYGTPIAIRDDGKIYKDWHSYSVTTSRHQSLVDGDVISHKQFLNLANKKGVMGRGWMRVPDGFKPTRFNPNDTKSLEKERAAHDEQVRALRNAASRARYQRNKDKRAEMIATIKELEKKAKDMGIKNLKTWTDRELKMASFSTLSQIDDYYKERAEAKHLASEIMKMTNKWTEDELEGRELAHLRQMHNRLTGEDRGGYTPYEEKEEQQESDPVFKPMGRSDRKALRKSEPKEIKARADDGSSEIDMTATDANALVYSGLLRLIWGALGEKEKYIYDPDKKPLIDEFLELEGLGEAIRVPQRTAAKVFSLAKKFGQGGTSGRVSGATISGDGFYGYGQLLAIRHNGQIYLSPHFYGFNPDAYKNYVKIANPSSRYLSDENFENLRHEKRIAKTAGWWVYGDDEEEFDKTRKFNPEEEYNYEETVQTAWNRAEEERKAAQREIDRARRAEEKRVKKDTIKRIMKLAPGKWTDRDLNKRGMKHLDSILRKLQDKERFQQAVNDPVFKPMTRKERPERLRSQELIPIEGNGEPIMVTDEEKYDLQNAGLVKYIRQGAYRDWRYGFKEENRSYIEEFLRDYEEEIPESIMHVAEKLFLAEHLEKRGGLNEVEEKFVTEVYGIELSEKAKVAVLMAYERLIREADDKTFKPMDPEEKAKFQAEQQAKLEDWVKLAKESLAREEDLDVDDLTVEDSEYNGAVWINSGREQYLVFQDTDFAYAAAREMLEGELESQPEVYGGDFLNQYITISDADRGMIAQEEADNLVDEVLSDDEILEEAGVEDEYQAVQEKIDELEAIDAELLKDPDYKGEYHDDEIAELEKQKEKILDDAKETVREQKYDEVYDALEDPIQYFVHDQGMYSIEDLMKANFISIDYAQAAEDIVYSDGAAVQLASYDHREINLDNGAVAYRTN